MKTLLDILIFAVVLGGLWIVALEWRFRSLKNAVGESEQLAQDAADEAEALLRRVEAELAKPKPAAKARKP